MPGLPMESLESLEEMGRKLLRRLRNAKERRNWFWIDDEEGVVQEVLLRFSNNENQGRFQWRSEEELFAYLQRTTFFVVMEAKDKRGIRKVDFEDARAFSFSSFKKSISDHLSKHECLSRLYESIDSLKESYRRIIELTLAGMKTGAIAKALDKPPRQVAVKKFRALRSLGKSLEKSAWIEDCGEEFALQKGERSNQ